MTCALVNTMSAGSTGPEGADEVVVEVGAWEPTVVVVSGARLEVVGVVSGGSGAPLVVVSADSGPHEVNTSEAAIKSLATRPRIQ